jgi:iron uptake system component EfeO
LDARFAAVEKALAKHRTPTGWKLYPELTKDDLKELSDAINALAEPVSKVGAAVVKR